MVPTLTGYVENMIVTMAPTIRPGITGSCCSKLRALPIVVSVPAQYHKQDCLLKHRLCLVQQVFQLLRDPNQWHRQFQLLRKLRHRHQ